MVTLIFSLDPYIAHMQGQKAYRALLKQGGQGVRLDMGENTYLDLYDECLRMPLCEGRKAIWADGCQGFAFREKISKDDEKGRAALSKLLAVPDLDFDLILTTSCKKLDERNPLVAAIKKSGSIKEANFPSDAECHAFVRKYLSSRGVGISDDAISEFLLRVGKDYARFLSELAKLSCFGLNSTISKEDVASIVRMGEENDAFKFASAVTSLDPSKAIKAYNDLIKQGYDEVRLISILGNELRFLDQVAYLDAKRMDEYNIASLLGCSPYRVRFGFASIRRCRRDMIEDMLEGLYQADLDILTGRSTPRLAMMRFFASLPSSSRR